jgi:hypothetical protein
MGISLARSRRRPVLLVAAWTGSHDRAHLHGCGDRVIAAYCPETCGCYVLSPEQFAGRRNVHLRVAPSLNNQQNGINWASDFAFEARLEALLGP